MSEDYGARAHKQIQIESWSNSARTLLLRGSTPGGPFAEQHTTNADRSKATNTYEIHGIPSKLQISPSTAPVRRGECYVRVTLLQDGEPVQRLSSAYITDSKTLSWPPGQFEGFTEGPGLIRVISGTDPAAGAEITEAVPTNARWRLLIVYASLVTDATVISRYVGWLLDDGAATFWYRNYDLVQDASKTEPYNLSQAQNFVAALGSGSNMPIPIGLLMYQGWRVKTQTNNLQAGDDWGLPKIVVEEWIEE